MSETETELKDEIKFAVSEYQCSGCMSGPALSCYKKGESEACESHHAGTLMSGVGRILLGMPKGFNRIGPVENFKTYIFEKFEDGWGYDKWNIPVWKHFDGKNTLVRGLSPRTNFPFLHIFVGDIRDKIDCLEITDEDVEWMD